MDVSEAMDFKYFYRLKAFLAWGILLIINGVILYLNPLKTEYVQIPYPEFAVIAVALIYVVILITPLVLSLLLALPASLSSKLNYKKSAFLLFKILTSLGILVAILPILGLLFLYVMAP